MNRLQKGLILTKKAKRIRLTIKNAEFTKRTKKKHNVQLFSKNQSKNQLKSKKDPVPMKHRAFHRSVWQQPNKTLSVSLGDVYCASSFSLKDNREAPEEMQSKEMTSKPNIDLLFSLFRTIKDGDQNNDKRFRIRRDRPRKAKPCKSIRNEDPYLTESCLPGLPKRTTCDDISPISTKEEVLCAIANNNNDISNENYSQLLSELVIQL